MLIAHNFREWAHADCFLHKKYHLEGDKYTAHQWRCGINKASLTQEITSADQVWQGEEYSTLDQFYRNSMPLHVLNLAMLWNYLCCPSPGHLLTNSQQPPLT